MAVNLTVVFYYIPQMFVEIMGIIRDSEAPVNTKKIPVYMGKMRNCTYRLTKLERLCSLNEISS